MKRDMQDEYSIASLLFKDISLNGNWLYLSKPGATLISEQATH